MAEPYTCDESNAARIYDWLKTRGGILVWKSIDLSDPGRTITTPASNADGTPATKPHWKMGDTPARHVTDPAEVFVTTAREYKRFHVAVRMGGGGMTVKVTTGGTNRIWRAIAKATKETGKPAWHVFDYGDYENAVILVEDGRLPIEKWKANQTQPAPT